jgi:hypothetical protein
VESSIALDAFIERYKIKPITATTAKQNSSSNPKDNALELPLRAANIGRDRGSLLHTTAVLRYHRACILEDLNKMDEAQKDYFWLDEFGYSITNDLY